jgi:hypothetical protein
MRRAAAFFGAAVFGLAAASAAFGAETPRIRFFLTAGAGFPGGSTSYSFQYDPHPGYIPAGSYAGQTLAVEPATGFDLQAGFLIPFGRIIGLRASFGWSESSLGGENGPYDLLFKYTYYSYLPPWDPILSSHFESTDWFPTFGSLKQASIGLDLYVRWPVSKSFDVALQAGPCLIIASGQVGGLGYTEYMGSSHGAQFFRDYILTLTLPSKIKLGWSVGLEAGLRLCSCLSLLLRAGFTTGGTYEAVPELETAGLYSGLTPIDEADFKELRDSLDLPALTLPLRRFGLALGLAFAL